MMLTPTPGGAELLRLAILEVDQNRGEVRVFQFNANSAQIWALPSLDVSRYVDRLSQSRVLQTNNARAVLDASPPEPYEDGILFIVDVGQP